MLQNCEGKLLRVAFKNYRQKEDIDYFRYDEGDEDQHQLPVVTLGIHREEVTYLRDFLCVCIEDGIRVISLKNGTSVTRCLDDVS